MSFSVLVFPWYAFSLYWWWVLLLPIPLTIYLGEFLSKNHVFREKMFPRRKALFCCALLIVGSIAVVYSTSAVNLFYFNTTNYLPTGLVESSVLFADIPDVQAAIVWVNKNVPMNSTVLVQERIQGFAYSGMRSDIQIRVSSSLISLNDASKFVFPKSNILYSIWFSDTVGNATLCEFMQTNFGKMSIFEIDKR